MVDDARGEETNGPGILWLIVIGFFSIGSAAAVGIRTYVTSDRLAGEIAFLLSLAILYLLIKRLVDIDKTEVADLISVSAFVVVELVFATMMRRSFAIGIGAFVFGLLKGFLPRGTQSTEENQGLAAGLLKALLFGGLAVVVTELVLRLWFFYLSEETLKGWIREIL